MDSAEMSATMIRANLRNSRIPGRLLTPEDVCLIMLDTFDTFHDLSGPEALSVSAEILTAWRNETTHDVLILH